MLVVWAGPTEGGGYFHQVAPARWMAPSVESGCELSLSSFASRVTVLGIIN